MILLFSKFLYLLYLIIIYVKLFKTDLNFKTSITNMTNINYLLWWIIIILCAIIMYYLISVYFINFVYSFSKSKTSINQDLIEKREKKILEIIYTFFSVVIVAPFFEELIFRKYCQDIFNNELYSIIISTLFFSFMHVANNKDFEWIFGYFPIGIINGFIYHKTNNLFSCIIIHMFINLVAFCLLIA